LGDINGDERGGDYGRENAGAHLISSRAIFEDAESFARASSECKQWKTNRQCHGAEKAS
jgi:hypothetical protein